MNFNNRPININLKPKQIRLSTCFLSIFMAFNTFLGFGQTRVKFNAATALILVPNVGVELPISYNFSVQLDVLGSFWDSVGEDRDPYQVNQTFFELRGYLSDDLNGFFYGAHIGYGMFTIQKTNALVLYDPYQDLAPYSNKNGTFQSGRAGFYGITAGWNKRLLNHWSLELFIGGGLVQSNYKGYNGFYRVDVLPGDTREFNKSGEWVLYRGGLMLVYNIPNNKSSHE